MCVVSAVLDTWRDQWKPQLPPSPSVDPNYYMQMLVPPPPAFTPEQIEVMKKFLEMAEKAKEIDKLTNQPNCEDPKKVDFLKEVLEKLEHDYQRLDKSISDISDIQNEMYGMIEKIHLFLRNEKKN